MQSRTSPKGRKTGFTLVELLTVIGIIAILIGILLPVLSRVREQSRRTKCLSNVRSLAQAMIIYADAHKGRLPNANPPMTADDYAATNHVLVALYTDYLKTAGVFHCPSDRDPAPDTITTGGWAEPNSARVSYDYFSVYWVPEQGPKLHKVNRAPLAWDVKGGQEDPAPEQNHGTAGGNVAFADGHAAWQPREEWDGENNPNPWNEYWPF